MIFVIVLSILVILSALAVISFKQPIYSALSLIFNMVLLALVYLNLGAEFLALSQIVVYAGAIMVLVVFVIMLLNINYEVKAGRSLYRTITPVSLAIVFIVIVFSLSEFSAELAFDGKITDVKELGKLLFAKYTFPFEITSILILAALLGAVVLSKVKHDES